ncbi:MAG: hypothetical protein SOR23_04125 [Candidatus Enterosoma sp.]|nr:hypothetical protein [Bacilli bacterium]MDY3047413.1 hypothetical protein [Candidatus Enterosoma sp.]
MILYPHCIFKDLTEESGISDVNSAMVQAFLFLLRISICFLVNLF